jgi:hypothetical protein
MESLTGNSSNFSGLSEQALKGKGIDWILIPPFSVRVLAPWPAGPITTVIYTLREGRSRWTQAK